MKHIVILKEPYFGMVKNGTKTIESRFSVNCIPPFQKVTVGDELLIKKTGAPVTLTATVKKVEYFLLTPQIVDKIRLDYGKQIGIDAIEAWEPVKSKNYGTLIWVDNVTSVPPLKVPRSNGAGWIVIK